MSALGPIYDAGLNAGLAAAAAYLDGRASLATDMERPGEALTLTMAAAGLRRLIPAPTAAPEPGEAIDAAIQAQSGRAG